MGFAAVGAVGLVALILLEPYRIRRLMSFLDPEGNKQGIRGSCIKLSLASGVGIGPDWDWVGVIRNSAISQRPILTSSSVSLGKNSV